MRVLDILDDFNENGREWKVGKSYYWILANKKEIGEINEKILLDEESLRQCLGLEDDSSKIIFFDGYMFLNLNILEYKNKIVKSKDLNIYLSKDSIITIYSEDIEIIEQLIKDINELKNCFMLKKNPEPAMVLYYIIDRIIVKNYTIISDLETRADEAEIGILKNPTRQHADDLIHLRRQLYKIRKYLNPLRYVGDSLVSNDNAIIEKDDIKYFHSINIKISKLMSTLESLTQDLALVREAYESAIANKTNDLMKIFTIITSIFLPLNLITGLKGMNFEYMPFIKSPYGYYYEIFIMIIITVILIYIFKRKRWI